MKPAEIVRLTPGKRALFLTKDQELIRKTLFEGLDLRMEDLSVDDLMDDINTDVMTPAWVCFRHRPEDIARDGYAGLLVDGERVVPRDALCGRRVRGDRLRVSEGCGEFPGNRRLPAEKWSGIRIAIASSFAPIRARNNMNQERLSWEVVGILRHLQAGEGVPPLRITRRGSTR